jgi:hypothetical protein
MTGLIWIGTPGLIRRSPLKFYQSITNKKIAAVYEEGTNWEHDPPTREYEAWAETEYGIERIYIAKHKLEVYCTIISEDEARKLAPALLETLHIARPDEVRPAAASPRFLCEHGEGCTLPEHSQGWLWREAQQANPSCKIIYVG